MNVLFLIHYEPAPALESSRRRLVLTPRRQMLVTPHRPPSQKWPSCLPNYLPVQLDKKVLHAGAGTLSEQGF